MREIKGLRYLHKDALNNAMPQQAVADDTTAQRQVTSTEATKQTQNAAKIQPKIAMSIADFEIEFP
jgi:hypothetical protein